MDSLSADVSVIDDKAAGPAPAANGEMTTPAPSTVDPFDPATLRLSQDFGTMVAGEKALLTVPVRKPSKEWWVRVHPDHRVDTAVIELKEDSDTYLLDRSILPYVIGEPALRLVTLYVATNRAGVVFLWPVPLPPTDGRDNPWYASARDIAALARDRWVRVTSNRSLGAYEATYTRAEIPDPAWPDRTFRDLLAIAFRDRRIDTLDHPILRRLREGA